MHIMHWGINTGRRPVQLHGMQQSPTLVVRALPSVNAQRTLQRQKTRGPQNSYRVAHLTHAAAAAASDSDLDFENFEDSPDPLLEDFEGIRDRGDRGYTPFEFIEFTDIPLKHEVSIWVDRPISDVYHVWHNRLNWMQWFDMIDEIGFHEEEPTYVSMYLWYRWATTPFLELYVTLDRTEEEENKFILEEPVEGLPLVAAVLFQEGNGNEDEDEQEAQHGSMGTTVTLRLSYLLPKLLHEFAGQIAVYGDVDKKLSVSMDHMKEFVENVDFAELNRVRRENEAEIRSNFVRQRETKAEAVRRREERAKEWEAQLAAAASGMGPESVEHTTRSTAPAAVAATAEAEGEGKGEGEGGATSEAAPAKKTTRRRATQGGEEKNPGTKRKGRRSKKAIAEEG